ncbi:hypothetical protein Lepto7375DRAFT_6284 [Leptolyngbya sp. PCC 7375]|nr:hypothetical protein Lepto7375DRAFT_6284 [Leptolyngbya sp. PCC 7375]
MTIEFQFQPEKTMLEDPDNGELCEEEEILQQVYDTLLLPMGPFTHKGYCSSAVLQHMQAGGLASKRLKNRYKLALKDFLEDVVPQIL